MLHSCACYSRTYTSVWAIVPCILFVYVALTSLILKLVKFRFGKPCLWLYVRRNVLVLNNADTDRKAFREANSNERASYLNH